MKKLGLTICALLCGLYLGACADVAIANNNQNPVFTGTTEYDCGWYDTSCLIDNDTGVNYIVVNRYGSGSAIAITPRLNADGSLYVSEYVNKKVYSYE